MKKYIPSKHHQHERNQVQPPLLLFQMWMEVINLRDIGVLDKVKILFIKVKRSYNEFMDPEPLEVSLVTVS